jgi:hypothetical protein
MTDSSWLNFKVQSPNVSFGNRTDVVQDDQDSGTVVAGEATDIKNLGLIYNPGPLDSYAEVWYNTFTATQKDGKSPATTYKTNNSDLNIQLTIPGWALRPFINKAETLSTTSFKYSFIKQSRDIYRDNSDLPSDTTKVTPNSWQWKYDFKGAKASVRQTFPGPVMLTFSHEDIGGKFYEDTNAAFWGKQNKNTLVADLVMNLGDTEKKTFFHTYAAYWTGDWVRTSFANQDPATYGDSIYDTRVWNEGSEIMAKIEHNGSAEYKQPGIAAWGYIKNAKEFDFAYKRTYGLGASYYGLASIDVAKTDQLFPKRESVPGEVKPGYITTISGNLPLIGSNGIILKDKSLDLLLSAAYSNTAFNNPFGPKGMNTLNVAITGTFNFSSIPGIGGLFVSKPTKKDLIDVMSLNQMSTVTGPAVFASNDAANMRINALKQETEDRLEKAKPKVDHTNRTSDTSFDVKYAQEADLSEKKEIIKPVLYGKLLCLQVVTMLKSGSKDIKAMLSDATNVKVIAYMLDDEPANIRGTSGDNKLKDLKERVLGKESDIKEFLSREECLSVMSDISGISTEAVKSAMSDEALLQQLVVDKVKAANLSVTPGGF